MSFRDNVMEYLRVMGLIFFAGLRVVSFLSCLILIVFILSCLLYSGPFTHSAFGWLETIIGAFGLLLIIGAAAEAGELLP